MALTTSKAGDGASGTSALSETRMLHDAWVVAWAASDISTMTPELPTLTIDMLVPKWTPGQVIPDGMYDGSRSGSNLDNRGL